MMIATIIIKYNLHILQVKKHQPPPVITTQKQLNQSSTGESTMLYCRKIAYISLILDCGLPESKKYMCLQQLFL